MSDAPPTPHATPGLGRRLWLLLIIFILPITVFSLPTLIVTHFFGQRPRETATGKTENTAAFDALRGSLEKAACESLPDVGLNLGARFEELTLACALEQADARLEALRGFAARCEGTATEQPADAAGRHLLVELPETAAGRFRQLASGDETAPAPPSNAGQAPTTARVFLNVTLAPAAGVSGSPATTAAVKTPP